MALCLQCHGKICFCQHTFCLPIRIWNGPLFGHRNRRFAVLTKNLAIQTMVINKYKFSTKYPQGGITNDQINITWIYFTRTATLFRARRSVPFDCTCHNDRSLRVYLSGGRQSASVWNGNPHARQHRVSAVFAK